MPPFTTSGKTLFARLFIVATVGLAAVPAAAGPAGSDRRLSASDVRDARQEQRIANGIANGTIGPREAARLDARNAHLDRLQSRLAADGNYSRRDYARVSYRQTGASRGIYRARHNRR